MIHTNIFNFEKTDYANQTSLFLGEPAGLFDTVNRRFPKIWEIYKNMKSLDWDELEFGFSSCNVEFKTRPAAVTSRMIKTLAWQWEADSIAARTILPVMAPFISAPELQAAWGRITDNEVLHAATYSEIVRCSFDDPQIVLNEVLKVKEAHTRLQTVSEVMAAVYKVSHDYANGYVKNDQETYNAAFLFTCAMLVLERLQFMPSFAVTFAIGETGAFMPIAKAVQKICQDEFEVHVALDKAILENELQTARGKEAYRQLLPVITKLIREVVNSELAWSEGLLGHGEQLVGLNAKLLKGWVLHSAGDVYSTLKIKPEFTIPVKNDLHYMENWMDISKTQPAGQEQQLGAYKVNVMTRNDEENIYQLDF